MKESKTARRIIYGLLFVIAGLMFYFLFWVPSQRETPIKSPEPIDSVVYVSLFDSVPVYVEFRGNHSFIQVMEGTLWQFFVAHESDTGKLVIQGKKYVVDSLSREALQLYPLFPKTDSILIVPKRSIRDIKRR